MKMQYKFFKTAYEMQFETPKQLRYIRILQLCIKFPRLPICRKLEEMRRENGD